MLRILDANLNRIGEGLRLLEEISRFLLDDRALTAELKGLRHELAEGARTPQVLASRRVAEDVGAFLGEEGRRKDLLDLVMANSRRVEEALRTLEEFSKLPEAPPGDWAKFKRSRFALYQLEQRLVARLQRRDKRVYGLYVILDAEALGGRSEVEVARAAIEGGAGAIQLRDKKRDKGELLPIAQELKKTCAEKGVLFIVNDHVDLALAAEADGVHLGQRDLPVATARRLLPGDKIIGCSTATVEEAQKAQEEGADYVAVGSIYPSPTKEATRPAGLKTLRRVKKVLSVPVVAIGGITEENIGTVVASGADAVAVISAVLGAPNVEGAARRLAAHFAEKKER